jgi:hypothetical protein
MYLNKPYFPNHYTDLLQPTFNYYRSLMVDSFSLQPCYSLFSLTPVALVPSAFTASSFLSSICSRDLTSIPWLVLWIALPTRPPIDRPQHSLAPQLSRKDQPHRHKRDHHGPERLVRFW